MCTSLGVHIVFDLPIIVASVICHDEHLGRIARKSRSWPKIKVITVDEFFPFKANPHKLTGVLVKISDDKGKLIARVEQGLWRKFLRVSCDIRENHLRTLDSLFDKFSHRLFSFRYLIDCRRPKSRLLVLISK